MNEFKYIKINDIFLVQDTTHDPQVGRPLSWVKIKRGIGYIRQSELYE